VLFDKIAYVYFFEKYVYILALEMASPGNRQCASCIGTLSFLIPPDEKSGKERMLDISQRLAKLLAREYSGTVFHTQWPPAHCSASPTSIIS